MGRNQRHGRRDGATQNDSTTNRRRERPERPLDGWDQDRRRGRGRGGGGRGPGGRGGGRRARRGDVRAAVLALLTDRPMHGYEMIGELSDRTNGLWSPSPGSMYPTLQLLEDEGLVAAEEIDGKRRFALTDEGRTQAEAATGPAPWERFADAAEEAALAAAVEGLMPAVWQVRKVGTSEQQAQVAELLVETRRKVYEVLAAE